MRAPSSATTSFKATMLFVIACTHPADRSGGSDHDLVQSYQPTTAAAASSSGADAGPPRATDRNESSFAGSGLLASDVDSVHVRGCLTESHDKLAQVPASRSPVAHRSEVRFSRADGTLVMTHSFTHACCLNVEVTRAKTADGLIIHERLFGKPCRCMCSSDIDVTLRDQPELKSVTVETEWPPGNSHTVFTGTPTTQ